MGSRLINRIIKQIIKKVDFREPYKIGKNKKQIKHMFGEAGQGWTGPGKAGQSWTSIPTS